MFKYIILFLLVLVFVPTVRRFLFWLIVGNQMVKEQKRQARKEKQESRREGDVKVDYIPDNGKNNGYKGGQYVDYEEVKD